jgi:hypothetical protein
LARYRLTAPHYVTRRNKIPAYLEAGTVIDSEEMPSHWEPSPLMRPLDAEAETEHTRVTQTAILNNGGPAIPGIGNARDMHRGDEHLDATGWRNTP